MNLLQFNQLPADLQAVISFKDFPVGQVLFAQYELAEAVFILESGYIRLLNYTEDGQQIIHYSVRAGESFAEVALFNDHYVCTAIAQQPSRVWIIPKQPFLIALKQHPDLAAIFMEQLARRLHESKLLLELRSIRPAQNRVLHYLQLNVQLDGITVNFDSPLQEIADNLGLTPETLSRTLKQLQNEKKISRKNRKVTLCKEFPRLDSDHGDSTARPINFRTS
jgi:CRP/FNR family transcriptional regulator, dissimilatory nitrate respiration regulator